MNVKAVLLGLCFLPIFLNLDAQKLSVGILSGVNRSNLHSDNTSGEWLSKTGAVGGINVNYALSPYFAVGTELNYTTLYYQYLPYKVDDPIIYPYYSKYSSCIYPPQYNDRMQHYDFSFVRFPMYLTLSVPGKVKFDLSLGCYYSIMDTYQFSDSYNSVEKPPKEDFGYMVSMGWRVPVASKVELYLKGRYLRGRKEYISTVNGKNGAAEILIGVNYTGLLKGTNQEAIRDSINKLSITYQAGFNRAWIKADSHKDSYSARSGFEAGVRINYRLDDLFSLETGLLYLQHGYQMSDSSSVYYRYVESADDQRSYKTDTKTQLNYFNLPVMVNFGVGDSWRFEAKGGVYYGFLLNASTTGTSTVDIYTNSGVTSEKVYVNDNIEGYITSNDWGWIGSATLQIPVFRQWKFDIGCTFRQGKKNILELDDELSNRGTTSMMNRSFGVNVGLSIPIQ